MTQQSNTKTRKAFAVIHVPATKRDGMQPETYVVLTTRRTKAIERIRVDLKRSGVYIAGDAIRAKRLKRFDCLVNEFAKDANVIMSFEAAEAAALLSQATFLNVKKTFVEQELCDEILRRRDHGLQKYGTSVERTDLTAVQWCQHALEESLDFSVYLKRMKRDLEKVQPYMKALLEMIDAGITPEHFSNIAEGLTGAAKGVGAFV